MALSFFDFEYFRSQGRFTQQRAPYFTYIFLLIENITRDAKAFHSAKKHTIHSVISYSFS
ncbi:hypothetical protein J2795_000832 [Chryseobacterium bernardetii]|uniref:Uncharacterized protein n=2 Tax=Chryseobacterium TaxID=59732 RepID=A0A543ELS7_9FLAO|nr:hypothetical protein [Chryseobacterium vietnamense]MDR6440147.1 hypothetical protein [Chryseobacterium bernardetii]TQM22541.1 hypothetical protein FB551_2254 [Chryseobacterium aquifrigidense]